MFYSNAEFLSILGQFLAAGVVIAVFWDIFRCIGIVIGAGKILTFVIEFILTILTAIVIMLLSLEIGNGKLRLYYFLSAMLGMAVYFMTIGFITRFIAVLAGKLFSFLRKKLYSLVYNPIVTRISFIRQKMLNVFAQMHQKTLKHKENLHFGLKKHAAMMYNNKIGKLCANGGEERNVIKAKVRKKA